MCDQAPADQPTEAPDAAGRIVQRRDNWSRETVRSLRRKLRNVKAEMGRHDAGRAKERRWFWGQIKQLREQISLLTADRTRLTAALQAAERREAGLRAELEEYARRATGGKPIMWIAIRVRSLACAARSGHGTTIVSRGRWRRARSPPQTARTRRARSDDGSIRM